MITDLAKRWTGLMAMGGVGLLLRAAAFAAMSWAAWEAGLWMCQISGPIWEWAVKCDGRLFVIAVGAVLPILGIWFATSAGIAKWWGFMDFLRRAPFIFWCVMTDDGRSVPLWAILAWPAVAVIEVALTVMLLLALPCWGVGFVVVMVCRAVWRVLSIRPLERRR